jgi:hypothetical protein
VFLPFFLPFFAFFSLVFFPRGWILKSICTQFMMI